MPYPPADSARPTMRDVAQAAGVSKALVSIVFRGAPGASDSTRAKVFEAAEQLGYRTNRTASLLKLTRTKHLGVTMRVRNTFHAEVVEAVQAAAEREGYEIVLSAVTESHGERRAIETLLDFRCEALILVGSDLPIAELQRLGQAVPVVMVGRPAATAGIDVVRTADRLGFGLVIDHLVRLGHREIVHVDGGPQPIAAERRRGYRAAMRRAGLAAYARTLPGGSLEIDGSRAASRLLAEERLPTAVTAFNDHCALGVIDGLTRGGVRVPQDCSVTGYDDSPIAGFAAVDLTTVSQEAEAQADWAVLAAVERLDRLRTEPRESVLEPRLVIRGSTGPTR